MKRIQFNYLLLMILALCAHSASAHDFEVDGIYYNYINNSSPTNYKVSVTYRGYEYYEYSNEYSGYEAIPTYVTYNGKTYRVTAIDDNAFRSCKELISVLIPKSVTSIGESAFRGCSSLTNVFFSDSENAELLSIGNYSFFECSALTGITLPESVTEIGNYAFKSCSSLTGFYLGNHVASIGNYAFSSCSGLTNVTIPNSIVSIGDYAFNNCSKLSILTIPDFVSHIGYQAFAGTLWYNNQPDGVIYAGKVAHSFKGTMPNGTNISLIQGTLGVAYKAFFGCSGLTRITIPNTIVHIDCRAFEQCNNLLSIAIPNSITNISNYLFYGCSGLTSITIPNSVTSIGESAFSGCTGLANITIPNSVTSIGESAFSGCTGLANITIPNSVTSIGKSAFSGCTGLTNIFIPNSITSISKFTFNNCSSLSSFSIPNTVTIICNFAFYGCSSLTSITIPSSVTDIGSSAFVNCDELSSITCLNSNPPTIIDSDATPGWISSPFSDYVYTYATLYVPSGAKNKYLSTQYWYRFVNIVELGAESILATSISLNKTSATMTEGNTLQLTATVLPTNATNRTVTWKSSNTSVATVSSSGLMTAKSPGSATITATTTDGTNLSATCFLTVDPIIYFADANVKALCVQNWDTNGDGELSTIEAASVTDLGTVFKSNKNITSFDELQYFTGLNSIGQGAFSSCSNLTRVIIPNSVTSIDTEAFNYCSGLTSVTIPSSVTSIATYSFGSCSGLVVITVESGNTKYDSRNNCNAIIETASNTLIAGCKATVIPNSVTSIGGSAFFGCSGLTSVTIPNSVTEIGSCAFEECRGLTSVTIPNAVTSIGPFAFAGCRGLTRVIVESGNSTYDSRDNCNAIIETHWNTLIAGCKATVIPNSVTSIYIGAFCNCSGLISVTIPNSVTSIGTWAFSGCSGLTSVTIPNSVSEIGFEAFRNCSRLNNVFSFIDDPTAVSMSLGDVFYRNPENYAERTLHVPFGTSAEYQADTRWSQYFGSIVEMDPILATSISLNETSANVTAGNTLQLTATVLPTNTTNKTVTWTSSNTSVATVSSSGLVTAKSLGSATITATTTDGTNLSATCAVTVAADLSDFDNYLSLKDAEAFHGDTIVIPVAMTNAESIIAFQTDIFMPEGLEIVQKNGDYLIDPSSRMTRTHSLMSNDVSSGAVRVMCYSSNYKPFTGNSGDNLFYITVKVADDAEGDYIIQLKNTLLTNTDFVDLAAPDVAATVNVKAYLLGDANNSGTVTITDVVVTAQYVMEMNPSPFIFAAADVNFDNNITVADVSRIVWMVLNPTLNAPRRAPALWNNGDRMSGKGVTLATGETRRVSIMLDNEKNYSAFQFDLTLPEGLTAGNFRLTDRAGSHAFDVNTLANGKTRALCYSPTLTAIRGNEGALLTFDVTATGIVDGNILVDGIEMVTTDCQTVRLDAFAIGVNNATSVNEIAGGKTVARVDYFNLAGQQIDRPESGVTLVVTTYTDGTRTTTKVIK